MVIEQTVEIPPSRRLTIEIPREIPAGRARVAVTIFPAIEMSDAVSSTTLSERFAGSLRLSDEEYEKRQTALQQSRDEWNRNIF